MSGAIAAWRAWLCAKMLLVLVDLAHHLHVAVVCPQAFGPGFPGSRLLLAVDAMGPHVGNRLLRAVDCSRIPVPSVRLSQWYIIYPVVAEAGSMTMASAHPGLNVDGRRDQA
jgi:hypothetical protein